MVVREGCHLCDDMRDALHAFRDELHLTWRELDVDSDAELHAQFSELVPVLLIGDREVCHYFFDLVALRRALAAEGS